MTVPASEWNLSLMDISNGNGVATVTMKSGVQFEGKVKKLDFNSSLATFMLHTTDGLGWIVIDYAEVAAITGKAHT